MATNKEDYKLGQRPLKNVDIAKIEEAIANSMSEIADEEYTVSIININFEPCQNAYLSDTIEIKLRLSRATGNNLFIESSEE